MTEAPRVSFIAQDSDDWSKCALDRDYEQPGIRSCCPTLIR